MKVADLWGWNGEGGWNISLKRLLNDWEVEEMAMLLGLLDTCLLRHDSEDVCQ